VPSPISGRPGTGVEDTPDFCIRYPVEFRRAYDFNGKHAFELQIPHEALGDEARGGIHPRRPSDSPGWNVRQDVPSGWAVLHPITLVLTRPVAVVAVEVV
jgi:hypothetical protein